MSGIFDQIINYSPPLIVSGTVNYDGTWDASTNTPTLNNPPAGSTKGDYYVVSVAGTQFSLSFAVGDWIISNGTAWEKVDLTDAVSSVFGRTGAVVGVSTDYSAVGLTNTAIGASSPSTGAFTTVSASTPIAVASGGTGVTTSTGTTNVVLSNSPTLVTPILGTPQSGTLTSCTGLPISTGVSGLGTGIATALAVNTGSAGAPVLFNGALGTPTSGTVTNLTGTASINTNGAHNGTVGATTPSTGAFTTVAASSHITLNDGSANSPNIQFTTTSGTRIMDMDASTIRILNMAATNARLQLTDAGNLTVDGSVTGQAGAFTTLSATTSGSVATLSINDTGANGANIRFVGDGATTPNKYIRVAGGKLEFLNNAYSAVIAQLSDAGSFLAAGGINSTAIGATTAAAGSFTTLAASTHVQATGGGNDVSKLYASGTLSTLQLGSPTEAVGGLKHERTTGAISIFNGTQASQTNIAVFSSTGLAVTGALSSTGAISSTLTGNDITPLSLLDSTLANGNFTQILLGKAANSNECAVIKFTQNATTSVLGFQMFGDGSPGLTISKGASGIAAISSSGLAVTGQYNGAFSGSGAGINVRNSSDTSGAFFLAFQKADNTTIGSITRVTTTDAVAYNTTSDARLKENLRDFTDSGRLIDSLKPRVFDWKNSDENGKNVVGFIAQEQHAADPIFAHIGAVSVGDEDPDTISKQWQRSDAALIPILVAELKSVRARLAALESK